MCSEQAIAYGNEDLAIRAQGVSKHYLLYARPQDRLKQFFWRGRRRYYTEVAALSNLSLTIRRGESVGIVGRNGSGKSTLLQLICGILTPSGGTLGIRGRISALLELGAGFNPEFTGRENVYLGGAIAGIGRQEMDRRFDDIAQFANIGAFIDRPVSTYSSGMFVRLAFAVAVAVDPEILVVDEALAVGDEAFQRKCFRRIRELQDRGCTILFVSHSAQTILEICSRALLMDKGELLMDGAPKHVIARYHQLIYASAEEEAAIRQAIADQQRQSPETSAAAQPHEGTSNTPAPESALEYDSHGGRIENPHLLTLDGMPVKILRTGERYQYRYRFTATEDLEHVRFGMLIKTTSGLELGGAGGHPSRSMIAHIRKNSQVDVNFIFTCCLRDGSYFMNCGCTKITQGEERFVHRIIDACGFKVASCNEREDALQRANGMIDFNIEAHCTIATL